MLEAAGTFIVLLLIHDIGFYMTLSLPKLLRSRENGWGRALWSWYACIWLIIAHVLNVSDNVVGAFRRVHDELPSSNISDRLYTWYGLQKTFLIHPLFSAKWESISKNYLDEKGEIYPISADSLLDVYTSDNNDRRNLALWDFLIRN